ncbi:hypothetical protein HMPREF0388_0497 [Mobiluncus curtisii ATCC 51333]|uniref:Uncharacterized protein n=1 Tax=Mobiluncus curtisii ATCC 51333 TaxID=887326 RepID=E6LWV0_9ACTO|nr:hypothetical protein HMPREF0388_0497 [Mobiluncus curtisii ATCC 51333]
MDSLAQYYHDAATRRRPRAERQIEPLTSGALGKPRLNIQCGG